MSEIIWDGEGLPPVGCICEVTDLGHIDVWRKIEILKHEINGIKNDARMAIIHLGGETDHDIGEPYWLYGVTDKDCKFRPIKSGRDKAIEDLRGIWFAAKSIEQFMGDIYDAGYRKVKTDDM